MPFLDEEIERTEKVLASAQPTSEAYTQGIQNLRELHKTRDMIEFTPKNKITRTLSRIVNNGPLMSMATTIGATLLVTQFERADVITSKAFSFIRPK